MLVKGEQLNHMLLLCCVIYTDALIGNVALQKSRITDPKLRRSLQLAAEQGELHAKISMQRRAILLEKEKVDKEIEHNLTSPTRKRKTNQDRNKGEGQQKHGKRSVLDEDDALSTLATKMATTAKGKLNEDSLAIDPTAASSGDSLEEFKQLIEKQERELKEIKTRQKQTVHEREAAQDSMDKAFEYHQSRSFKAAQRGLPPPESSSDGSSKGRRMQRKTFSSSSSSSSSSLPSTASKGNATPSLTQAPKTLQVKVDETKDEVRAPVSPDPEQARTSSHNARKKYTEKGSFSNKRRGKERTHNLRAQGDSSPSSLSEEIKALKEEYRAAGGDDEDLWAEIEELEAEERATQEEQRKLQSLHHEQAKHPNHSNAPPYPRAHPPPPYGIPPYRQHYMQPPQHPYYANYQGSLMQPPPHYQPQQKQSNQSNMLQMMFVQQMQQQEAMNKQLLKELEVLRSKKADDGVNQQRREMQRMINVLAQKAQAASAAAASAAGSMTAAAAAPATHPRMMRGASTNWDAFDDSVPKAVQEQDTKFMLEKARILHKKELMELQHEFERFKTDLTLRKTEEEEQREHENFLKRQKRELIQARMERLKMKELSQNEPAHAAFDHKPYSPVEGLVICFDWCTMLPKNAKNVYAVYSVWDAETKSLKLKPKKIKTTETEVVSPSENQAIFHDFKNLRKVPMKESLVLFLQLQRVYVFLSVWNVLSSAISFTHGK